MGELDGDQWEEIFQAMNLCSLNVSQKRTQIYILLRTYYITHRLHLMNLQDELTCTRCKRDHGDLIHMLWRCPKLHTYWEGVVRKVNSVFVNLSQDPRACLLGALEEYEWEGHSREAVHRVLFQARKLIMTYWKSEKPPTIKEWTDNINATLRLERLIYQHRGSMQKFEKLWAPWLDVSGLAPLELVK